MRTMRHQHEQLRNNYNQSQQIQAQANQHCYYIPMKFLQERELLKNQRGNLPYLDAASQQADKSLSQSQIFDESVKKNALNQTMVSETIQLS